MTGSSGPGAGCSTAGTWTSSYPFFCLRKEPSGTTVFVFDIKWLPWTKLMLSRSIMPRGTRPVFFSRCIKKKQVVSNYLCGQVRHPWHRYQHPWWPFSLSQRPRPCSLLPKLNFTNSVAPFFFLRARARVQLPLRIWASLGSSLISCSMTCRSAGVWAWLSLVQ